MGEPPRVTSIFSLSASNSVPMPAVGECNVQAGSINERCDERTSSFRWKKSVRLSIASEARHAT